MQRRIQVLVVASCLAILITLLVGFIQYGRASARRIECVNNMRQLCGGVLSYQFANNSFPLGAIGNPQFPPERRWSWYVHMAPYLAQAASPPIDYLADSRDSKNWPLTFPVSKGIETFAVRLHHPNYAVCPSGLSEEGEHQQVLATYVGMTGIGPESATARSAVGPLRDTLGIWGYDRAIRRSQISDDRLDKTILLIETVSDRDVWLLGGRGTVRWQSEDKQQIGAGRNFGGLHYGVAVTGMADASVLQLSNNIDPLVFSRLATLSH